MKYGQCAEESHTVKTVCLPPPHQSLQSDVPCEIAGYGKENYGEESRLTIVVLSDNQ